MSEDTKIAVITGASRGLGAGMASVFAAAGLHLGLCARHTPTAPPNITAVTASVDVSDPQAMEDFCTRVAQEIGPIDLWINNAGILDPVAPARDLDPAAFRQLLEINVLGVLHGTQSYLRHRREQGGGGVLVNISSGAAQRGIAGWSAYCASKGAVDRFTEAVALEEEASGLRAYAIAPGVVDTDMQSLIRSMPEERFPNVARFQAMKEQGHFNTAEFVGREILAMVFDPARHPETTVVRVTNEWEQ